jgi:tRNA-specific 2-thiouridylase
MGLGSAAPYPLSVLQTHPALNVLIVATKTELGRHSLIAGRVNWISGLTPETPIRAEVKIRYKSRPAPATVTPLPDDRVEVVFDEPMRDITPGQGAVFYQGEVCLGGGIIARVGDT